MTKKLCQWTVILQPHIVRMHFTELSAIYPITPSSPMADGCCQWADTGSQE